MQQTPPTPRSRQQTTSVPARDVPPNRTFVLHLDADTELPRRVIGRVEHVASGRVTRVASVGELGTVIAEGLRQHVAGTEGESSQLAKGRKQW